MYDTIGMLFVELIELVVRANGLFFLFNDTATTEIYTLSLHDALPILPHHIGGRDALGWQMRNLPAQGHPSLLHRSEEHTSELQSRPHLVCRLLLEKKKTTSPALYLCSIIRTHRYSSTVASPPPS